MREFARMVGEAKSAVFAWSMGVTQHQHGEDNIRSIVNLGLTKASVDNRLYRGRKRLQEWGGALT